MASAADTGIGSYTDYTNNVTNYCQLQANIPNKANLWNGWESDSLIKLKQVSYADITKQDIGDKAYIGYLSSIKSDPNRINSINLLSASPNFLDKASYVYAETMNTIYACAVLNAKIKIIKNILENIPTNQSNIKLEMQKQLSIARSRIDPLFCRNISDGTNETSIKKQLLDNTMYQYCTYRYYLYYLESASKNNMNTYFAGKKGDTTTPPQLATTDSAATYLQLQGNRITQEIAHVKEIFPQALVAYTEFERTYGSHIILTFIFQDYVDLRDTIKNLLNPIGQVIYKASNAQSPGK